ncbi:MAG: peptidoglycan-binding protein [Dermatophilaceae bacterium]
MDQPTGPVTPRVRGRRWIGWWGVVSAALIVLSFLAGTVLPSPWRDARANSVISPLVTAEVARRSFTAPVAQASGVIRLGTTIPVEPTASDGQVAVVTATPRRVGDVIQPGDAVIDVSGRPLVFLRLAFPLYRDLRRGDRGADVTALQRGLANAGLYQGAADGDYGVRTADAVARLYRGAGSTAPGDPADAGSVVNGTAENRAEDVEEEAADDPAGAASAPSPVSRAETAAPPRPQPGGWLPRAEILAADVPRLTLVTVARVGTTLGTDSTTAATLRGGEPRVTARVPAAAKGDFASGRAVRVVTTNDAGRTTTGSVVTLGAFSGGSDSQPAGYDATISVPRLASDWQDGDRVTVTSSGSEAAAREAVAVPLTAVRHDTEGDYVSVEQRPGDLARVRVEVGLQDSGWVEVVSGDLRPGQRVVVAGG